MLTPEEQLTKLIAFKAKIELIKPRIPLMGLEVEQACQIMFELGEANNSIWLATRNQLSQGIVCKLIEIIETRYGQILDQAEQDDWNEVD
ncbi:hypothetical protein SHAb15599_00139 [Acinetobacter phage SH-Ab 15599]|nr:hypothetical protein SHAb15599_00139 [Acinetobacter phage SH-Ab 15599]